MAEIPYSQLLDLPAELRLQIYEYAVPAIPLHARRAEYTGLVYACKHTQTEVTPLILQRMRDIFVGISKECLEVWDEEVTFSNAQTLHELENLVVERRVKVKMSTKDHPLTQLLDMHFKRLNIRLSHTSVNEKKAMPGPLSVPCMLERFLPNGHQGPIAKIHDFDYDWSQVIVTRPLTRDRIRKRTAAAFGTAVVLRMERHRDLHKEWLVTIREDYQGQGQPVAIRLQRPRSRLAHPLSSAAIAIPR